MTSDHRAQVDELLADYRRSREQLRSVHEELAALSETARSADGTVTVTVGAQGTLNDLALSHTAYERYRPDQLAAVVLRLSAQAATSVAARAQETLTPVLPSGTDPAAVWDEDGAGSWLEDGLDGGGR